MTDPRRLLPRTDEVLAEPRLAAAGDRLAPAVVAAAVRGALEGVRSELAGDDDVAGPPSTSALRERVVARALASLPERATSLRPVVNATGVVVHTNLGRAPLSGAARSALEVAAGTCDVELDLATGRRGPRGAGARRALLDVLPEAQDALLVANGAAAVLLAVHVLAAGREVLVSRGEMVEIGDGFRLPDLLVSTGVRLREVGTTNRTRPRDYVDAARAPGADAAALLKVHPSNFRVVGFTQEASVRELAAAGLGLPLVADTGSGLLRHDPLLPDEPSVASALAAGADLVTSSGDKLLGGPQAGLLVGRADLVARCRRSPLARALRVDALTLASLEATLRGPVPPVVAALHAEPEVLRERCERLAARLRGGGVEVDVVASEGVVGGGGAPGQVLPGWALAVGERLARPLRLGDPAVLGRTEGGRLLLDVRCVAAAEEDGLVEAVVRAGPCARETASEHVRSPAVRDVVGGPA